MKKSVEVYQDLRSEGSSARRVVDLESGLVACDERIGCQGFATVGASFRQTRNPCPQAVFIVQDEHDGFPLFSLAPARVAGDRQEKYTSLALSDCPLKRQVLPQ